MIILYLYLAGFVTTLSIQIYVDKSYIRSCGYEVRDVVMDLIFSAMWIITMWIILSELGVYDWIKSTYNRIMNYKILKPKK